MALPLKYRPANLKQVIGNKDTISSLDSLLKRDKKDAPHSFLFYGEAGCGKTSLARIVANEFGAHVQSIVEINMSNNRGIDTAREIENACIYSPLKGECTVYILDEVHRSTKDFQNALLKILEEPPPHVRFMLCTTEPEKLLKTIRSRCTSYQVEKPTSKRLFKHLQDILEKEDREVDDEILNLIVKESGVVPRDALKMLDQIMDVDDEKSMLKIISSIKNEGTAGIDLCRALLDGKNWKVVSGILSKLSAEPESVRRMVLGYMNSVVLRSGNKRAHYIMECFADNYYDTGKAGLTISCYDAIHI